MAGKSAVTNPPQTPGGPIGITGPYDIDETFNKTGFGDVNNSDHIVDEEWAN